MVTRQLSFFPFFSLSLSIFQSRNQRAIWVQVHKLDTNFASTLFCHSLHLWNSISFFMSDFPFPAITDLYWHTPKGLKGIIWPTFKLLQIKGREGCLHKGHWCRVQVTSFWSVVYNRTHKMSTNLCSMLQNPSGSHKHIPQRNYANHLGSGKLQIIPGSFVKWPFLSKDISMKHLPDLKTWEIQSYMFFSVKDT